MDFITIVILVLVLVFAAHVAVEDKVGTSSPSLILKQIASWLSFGLLFTKDLILTTTTEVQLMNAEAKLEIAQSGNQIDLGWVEGGKEYKSSEIRKVITERRKQSSMNLKKTNKSLEELLKDQANRSK